jgi:hypothetical protein
LVGFVEAAVEPSTQIVNDAWGAYNSLTEKGYRHVPVPIRGDPALAEDYLPIMHLVFANLKSWLRGCHQGGKPATLAGVSQRVCIPLQPALLPVQLIPVIVGNQRTCARPDV